nr:MAG TPA: hypothetical protein [Caudoviricetes sp.]
MSRYFLRLSCNFLDSTFSLCYIQRKEVRL